MAQTTKVFAPEGYHFMIKKAGGFYLMAGAYTPHTLANGDKSSDYVLMNYRTEHPSESDITPERKTTANTVKRVNSGKTVSMTNRARIYNTNGDPTRGRPLPSGSSVSPSGSSSGSTSGSSGGGC